MRKLIITAISVCLTMPAIATDIPGSGGVPDLVKGGKLKRINKRWAGPLGIYCGAWRPVNGRDHAHQAKYVRQLLVLEVDKGSPADGILETDDVILGADGAGAEKVPLFESAPWAMIPIANAITEAEARSPAILKLLIWRPVKKIKAPSSKKRGVDAPGGFTDGKTQTVTIKLESLGRYSDTAPYNCEKSKRILRKGIKALYDENKPDKAGFGMLCLLAADDPTNPDNEKYQARAREWAHKIEVGGGPWFSGPKLISLSEYYMKTKDKTIFPKLAKQAEMHARGVSWFGTTGHKWCDKLPDGSRGRLSGYGPINCSGALGLLGLSLARKAGVRSPVVEAANRSQRIFFGHFAFHSGIGYGEMPYAIAGGRGDTNGKCSMSALALGLEKDQVEKAKYFTRMAALATFSRRQYAHGGSFFGQMWHPIGAAQGGVKTANLQFKEIRWHLDLKRRWNHTRIYDSSGNNYKDFGYYATALLFYAMPLKQLYITGRGQKESLKLSDVEFDDLLKIKNFNAAEAANNELIAELSRHQGMTRSAASEELANRIKAKPESPESAALVDQLLALAADSKAAASGRAGACTTLMFLKKKAKGPVGELKNAEIAKAMVSLLKDPDPYIRFGGVRALQQLNPEAVRPHVNEILDAIIATERPTFPLDEEDPLQWAHGEMGAILFKHMLAKSIDGVDRAKLLPAIRSLLKTPNADARCNSSRVLTMLTMDETLELADVIVDNIMVAPPGNAMGGASAPNCQNVLAKYLFEETLPLSVEYDNRSGAGMEFAIKSKIPQKYGKSALTMDSASELMRSLGDLMLVKAINVSTTINEIQNGAAPEKLNKLKRIHAVKALAPALTLPAAKTELVVDATNYGRRGENETTYTWRKVYGAGKVRFTPNASGKSKKTTVSFTDQKPGRYRFEVTMSDTLGYNELTRTIDVTLYDKRGKLPRNRPPRATSQTLKAVPGLPLPITLSGTDPDGDDLGFIVTKGPSHGKLSGVGGKLAYTANFGRNGTDRLTFDVVDGQGKKAAGTVQFRVSDQNVGVVVYEGFDYPPGAIHSRGGNPSFGFNGPWTNTRGSKDYYLVTGDSLSYPDLPSTGGKLVKGKGWWPLSRRLDSKALSAHKLLDNGRELWFSIVVGGMKGRGKFYFNLKDGNNPKDGTAIGFGFDGPDIFATKNGKKAGTSRVGWSRSKHVMFQEKAPNMIIGRCVWGKTDADPDTLELYRVFDAPELGPLVVRKPVCVLREVIPQAKINQVSLTDLAGGVDEIRIGPTLHSVMAGTKQLK